MIGAAHDRILGLDYGTQRIGIAVTDPLGSMALPLQNIDGSKGWPYLVNELNTLIQKYSIGRIVVGNPKTLKGEIGLRAEEVLKFVDKLKRSIDTPITLWDERLSSKAVERILIEKGLSREKRKTQIDAEAAAFFLQGYLDAQK